MAHISEKYIQLDILGFITGMIDIDNLSDKINFNLSQKSNKKYISILENEKAKNKLKEINEGDTILVKLTKLYPKANKTLMCLCEIDLQKLI